jgi:hypothetical protein
VITSSNEGCIAMFAAATLLPDPCDVFSASQTATSAAAIRHVISAGLSPPIFRSLVPSAAMFADDVARYCREFDTVYGYGPRLSSPNSLLADTPQFRAAACLCHQCYQQPQSTTCKQCHCCCYDTNIYSSRSRSRSRSRSPVSRSRISQLEVCCPGKPA